MSTVMQNSSNDNGISIIICTNRNSDSLTKVIISLTKQKIIKFKVELVIVYLDKLHNLQSIESKLNQSGISIKLVQQKSCGIARARNLGALNASYEIIVYIDDDTIPIGKEWLMLIKRIFSDRTVCMACGKILLYRELPEFFSLYKWTAFTYFNYGQKPCYLSSNAMVNTAHFMIRKSLLLSIGGFRPELGRYKNKLMSGEDEELTKYLNIRGFKIYYHPKLKVKHLVSTERMRPSFLYSRLFWQGITDITLKYLNHENIVITRTDIIGFLLTIKRALVEVIKNGKYKTFQLSNFYFKLGLCCGIFFGKYRTICSKDRPLDIYRNI